MAVGLTSKEEMKRSRGVPRISVVIPAYNRAPFVERCVRSVLSQTYGDLEVIVVDDGSVDSTCGRVGELERVDHRIRCLRHETNRGAQAARNTGIRAARGSYVAFLDSDNEWLPHKLEQQIALFDRADGRLSVAYSGFRWEYDDGSPPRNQEPRHRGYIYRNALREWVADTSTIVVDKEALFRIGLCDEGIHAYQEWDLCIRLAKHYEFDYVADPLAIYHSHDGPMISKDPKLSAKGYMDIIEAHGEEMVTHCGRKTLMMHYLQAGRSFVQAGDNANGSLCFCEATRTAPISLKAWRFRIALKMGIDLHGIRARVLGAKRTDPRGP